MEKPNVNFSKRLISLVFTLFGTSASGKKTLLCLIKHKPVTLLKCKECRGALISNQMHFFGYVTHLQQVFDSSNQFLRHLRPLVMIWACHTHWLPLINICYQSSGVEVIRACRDAAFWNEQVCMCAFSALICRQRECEWSTRRGEETEKLGIQLDAECVNWLRSAWECLARL